MDNVLNLRLVDISKKKDVVSTIFIFLLCLLVPAFLEKILLLFISDNNIIINNIQLIVGSIINTLLFISAYYLKGKIKIIGICTMPSISTILSGYIFGINAISIFMIPFIWLGNFILVYFMKYLVLNNKKNIFISGLISIISKVLIIFISFLILNCFVSIEDYLFNMLFISMSYMQLITAFIGLVLSSILIKYNN